MLLSLFNFVAHIAFNIQVNLPFLSLILCQPVVAESDMDLDLLGESESDSESSHSNQDNGSVQRSAVTAATAGSDAGRFQLVTAMLYILII